MKIASIVGARPNFIKCAPLSRDEFKKMKLGEIKNFINDKPVLIDVGGMFDEEPAKGFYYRCL